MSDEQEIDEDTALFRLEKSGSNYVIAPQNMNKPDDRLWMVIRSLKDGYTIQKYDIIKLGRMKFRVKEFRTEGDFFQDHDNSNSPHQGFDEFHEVEQATGSDIMCRFCWTGEQTEDNPII